MRQERQQQKKAVGKGGQQHKAPNKVNVGGASDAELSAKIELLEKRLAAALAIKGDASTSQSSDLRSDWMFAGTAHVEPVEAGAAVTRGKGKAQEPRGADVDLDPQRGEGGKQTRLPQSFLLSEVVRTPVMAPIPMESGSASDVGVGPTNSVRGPSDTAVAVSNTMLGAATALCELPLFSATQIRTVGFDSVEVFRLAATLCESEQASASTVEVATKQQTIPQTQMLKEPWQAAAANLVNLSARPAIERTMVRPNVILLDNRNKVFSLVGPSGKVYWPQRVMLDSGAQPLMLGKVAFHGLGMKRSNVDKCPFQIQTSVGGVGSTEWLTRNPLRLTFLPGHQIDESKTSVQAVVTGADSYDVLIGSAVLYPLGFVLDYWGERVSF